MDKWISVEDRLPEFEQSVYVYYADYINGHPLGIPRYDIATYGGSIAVWGRAQITHWMPLPAPPKDN